jgi:hypothetical protein
MRWEKLFIVSGSGEIEFEMLPSSFDSGVG